MKKLIVLIAIVVMSVNANGQYVIDYTYEPMSYDIIYGQLMMAQAAHNQAVNDYQYYYNKGVDYANQGFYSTAKYYFEKCLKIDQQIPILSKDDRRTLLNNIRFCEQKLKDNNQP